MLIPTSADMLSAFCAENVDFMVVGAYALAAHGYPRARPEILICGFAVRMKTPNGSGVRCCNLAYRYSISPSKTSKRRESFFKSASYPIELIFLPP